MPPTFTCSQVRLLRHRKGLTQQDLASRAGLAYRTVSVVENGGRVKRKTVEQIADALGVPFDTLVAAPEEAAS